MPNPGLDRPSLADNHLVYLKASPGPLMGVLDSACLRFRRGPRSVSDNTLHLGAVPTCRPFSSPLGTREICRLACEGTFWPGLGLSYPANHRKYGNEPERCTPFQLQNHRINMGILVQPHTSWKPSSCTHVVLCVLLAKRRLEDVGCNYSIAEWSITAPPCLPLGPLAQGSPSLRDGSKIRDLNVCVCVCVIVSYSLRLRNIETLLRPSSADLWGSLLRAFRTSGHMGRTRVREVTAWDGQTGT